MSQLPDELSQELELMTRVASLYYLEDVTQGAIADALGLSLPKVGRLLKKAREVFPHLWYWHDASGMPGCPWYHGSYLLALELWSSYPSLGLAEVVARCTHLTLQPGARRTAQLIAAIGTGMRRVRPVALDGTMLGREEENPS